MINRTMKPDYDVFISYRWVPPDQEWVRKELFPSLQAARVQVLLDVEDFVPGRDLILEMSRAGRSSRFVLCVVTPDYFDGNRMVSFEALAARRDDPSGRESKLVPLILRKTAVPDWMRGLIPLDWTEPERHSREWSKLLKLLEAPYQDVSPPGPLHRLSEGKQPHTDLEVISVHPMVAANGKGLGYRLILVNRGSATAFICGADVHGWRKTETHGSDRMLRRLVFAVDLSCSPTAHSEVETLSTIRGETYDDAPEWASVSE